ncbi:LysR family hydrogen peroxide-inducible transcriptional activator [Mesorhizobium sp. J18]|uniref:hydrogen peroxide-inducible genes activator n=1 Tax=Mesorhizobium sp. J18 TaxID=935263 RepID=UPI00119AD8BE|nr:hydrogen peroxide-inducible genes activator [Mesorhizobium sp. J18]TWG89547.1 LysR family hydrogen peroxide-inducible transcriptional activator [Mesorhizobium sp. J18]
MIGLTIRQMQYFQALAETRHFGRAAALAGVSQPALSAQIAEMETRLACRLFERGKGVVRLTEEGRMLLPRIEKILAEISDLEAVARRGRRMLEGRFRIGIIPTVAPYLLPHVLPELRSRFPALQTELREAVTGTLMDETLSGRLDAFIAALPIGNDGLVSETLFTDRFFLAVPPDDPAFVSPPVPPESPSLERLMLLEEGHCLREQALAVCGQVKPVAMARYGATSLTTLLQMVAHGMGITLIPEMAIGVAQATRNLKIVSFADPVPSRTICLAWRRNSPRQDECRILADLIRETAPRVLLSDKPEEMQRQPEPQYAHGDEAGQK